jgi:hypothetical protein
MHVGGGLVGGEEAQNFGRQAQAPHDVQLALRHVNEKAEAADELHKNALLAHHIRAHEDESPVRAARRGGRRELRWDRKQR